MNKIRCTDAESVLFGFLGAVTGSSVWCMLIRRSGSLIIYFADIEIIDKSSNDNQNNGTLTRILKSLMILSEKSRIQV